MTPGLALQPLRVRLESLVNESSSALPASSISLLREVGLTGEEISSLVFAGVRPIPDPGSSNCLSPDQGERLRLVAEVLSRCLDVFGSDKKAIYWLHQPVSRFQRQSPLQFLTATSNAQEVDEYLTQIEEGTFA